MILINTCTVRPEILLGGETEPLSNKKVVLLFKYVTQAALKKQHFHAHHHVYFTF